MAAVTAVRRPRRYMTRRWVEGLWVIRLNAYQHMHAHVAVEQQHGRKPEQHGAAYAVEWVSVQLLPSHLSSLLPEL